MLRHVDHAYTALMDQLQDAFDEELRLAADETDSPEAKLAQKNTRVLSEQLRMLMSKSEPALHGAHC